MPGWLSLLRADVPAGDGWLTSAERDVQAGLRLTRRRADWRLGRWTAKRAVASWAQVEPDAVEILAAGDGAPEAWIAGERAPVSVSISHRAGRALAAVTASPGVVGCDLELVEPRSAAFVRDWLSAADQAVLAAWPAVDRALVANLVWTAKEAVAKVRREGLRLDVRAAVVAVAPPRGDRSGWHALRVDWDDGATLGWWCARGDFVMAITARPAPGVPRELDGASDMVGRLHDLAPSP